MGKKQTCPNKKIKARRAKWLADMHHNNIPKSASPAKELNADDYYAKLRDARKAELKKFSDSPARHTKSKKPWYMLSKAKYHYETHHEEWGDHTAWFKVESESTRLYNKTIPKKFTKNDLVIGYLDKKMEDWQKKHPMPNKDDLFYKEEYPKWQAEYETQHDRVVKSLVDHHIDKYNKKTIEAVLTSRAKYSAAA